jgi:two-component system, NarL family, nitrate/nitrite response regulator NarL
MGTQVATIIIEPRLLVRQALESLMMQHSYRVVCGVGSIADVADSTILAEEPRLAILGAQSADRAATEAVGLRKLWPNSKIILLFEQASRLDFQKLLASQVDGCVPLSVSPETLISTLDLIIAREVRVMVVADAKQPALAAPGSEGMQETEAETNKLQSNGASPAIASSMLLSLSHGSAAANGSVSTETGPWQGGVSITTASRSVPKLSERETQILDGLVKGHANKVIARTCDITEATVKVHMKSILRKIQVANRTQAAVWALEHGHSVYPIKDAC